MTISVCIPTVRPTTLGAAIASIRRQTYTDWELIVVGQGADKTLESVTRTEAENDPRVRYIHIAQSGASVARNAGLQAAAGDIVAFIDDDCEAHLDWLEIIAECFEAQTDVGVVGGAMLWTPPGRRGVSLCPSVVPGEVIYDPVTTGRSAPHGFDWLSANFAIRRAVAQDIGPFDEHLGVGATFMAAEDVDYKLRLEAAGVQMWSTPRCAVSHTYGRRYGLRNVVRYWHRNEMGMGALAAKLTMMGDPRGHSELRGKVWEFTLGWLRRPRPHQPLSNPVRLHGLLSAYNRCRREFQLDSSGRVLERVVDGQGSDRSERS